MRNSGNIDIHMIPAEESARAATRNHSKNDWHAHRGSDFGIALGIAAGVTAFSLVDIRLHRLLGCRAFLSARRRSRRNAIAPLADIFSRRA